MLQSLQVSKLEYVNEKSCFEQYQRIFDQKLQQYIHQKTIMFAHSNCENDFKFDRILQEKTGSNFASNDQSFIYEVQAQREYVQRLKAQRQKIEGLYAKYDVLLNELKNKDLIIKEKDRKIGQLENKCKNLYLINEESSIMKQQATQIKNQNLILHKNLSHLEQQCEALHNHLKTKQISTSHKNDELQLINEELFAKMKALSKKYHEKDQELSQKTKAMAAAMEHYKIEAKTEKSKQSQEIDAIRTELLLRIDQNNNLVMENQFIKERLMELESNFAENNREFEEKLEKLLREKKMHFKTAKLEIESLREANQSYEKKMANLKDLIIEKDRIIAELKVLLQEQQKQASENIFLCKQQATQQKNSMKEQLLYCQNHISKLERRLTQSFKKEKDLIEAIRKYQACLDAKRNLREVEKEELDRINLLLSFQ